MSNHTEKSSQRTIDRHRLPPNSYTFKQPWGRRLLKVPSFYRYFSRNPFVIQKPCPSFCIPKSFSDYSQARSRDHLCKMLVIIPFYFETRTNEKEEHHKKTAYGSPYLPMHGRGIETSPDTCQGVWVKPESLCR